MKGLIINIYRTQAHGGYDCTNGGVTAKANQALLIGEGIAEVFDAKEMPVLVLTKGNLPGCAKIEPADKGERWSMFGGNFGHTSDSRFSEAVEKITGARFYGAVPIHDRFE